MTNGPSGAPSGSPAPSLRGSLQQWNLNTIAELKNILGTGIDRSIERKQHRSQLRDSELPIIQAKNQIRLEQYKNKKESGLLQYEAKATINMTNNNIKTLQKMVNELRRNGIDPERVLGGKRLWEEYKDFLTN